MCIRDRVCTVQYSAFARHWQPLPVYRRLADNACWSHLFLRKHYRPFQLPGVRHLLADPLPADLYRRLPEADEVFVRHSGNGGNDAITDR